MTTTTHNYYAEEQTYADAMTWALTECEPGLSTQAEIDEAFAACCDGLTGAGLSDAEKIACIADGFKDAGLTVTA